MKLIHHTYAEWAELVAERLRFLGCSKAYADAERLRIIREEKK